MRTRHKRYAREFKGLGLVRHLHSLHSLFKRCSFPERDLSRAGRSSHFIKIQRNSTKLNDIHCVHAGRHQILCTIPNPYTLTRTRVPDLLSCLVNLSINQPSHIQLYYTTLSMLIASISSSLYYLIICDVTYELRTYGNTVIESTGTDERRLPGKSNPSNPSRHRGEAQQSLGRLAEKILRRW